MYAKIFEISILVSLLYFASLGTCQEKPSDILCRTGKRQSPINVVTADAKLMEFTTTVEVVGFTQRPIKIDMKNNGLNIRKYIKWGDNHIPTLRSPLLPSTYVFDYIEYHWVKEGNGSRHTIDGRRYPMEIHVVWHNENYESLQMGDLHEDGVVVIAIFVDLTESDYTVMTRDVEPLKNLVQPGDRAEMKDLSPLYFPRTTEYYAYDGSMTEEPCSEVVTWFVVSDMVTVNRKELALFQNVRLDERANAYARPAQPLNGRPVYHVRAPKN